MRNILQLILAPSRGWEDISACKADEAELMRTGLYPFISLAAVSVFGRLIYNHDLNVALLFIMACAVFISFFISYFLSKVIFKSFLYHYSEGLPNETRYSTVILYTISLLALSTMIVNLMPVKLGMEYLLPLAVAMVLWKANVYLGIRGDRDVAFIVFGILAVILPPILIQFLFVYILG